MRYDANLAQPSTFDVTFHPENPANESSNMHRQSMAFLFSVVCSEREIWLAFANFNENEMQIFNVAPICCLSMQFITFHIVVGCRKWQRPKLKKKIHKTVPKTTAHQFASSQKRFSVCRKLSENQIDQVDRQSAFCQHDQNG